MFLNEASAALRIAVRARPLKTNTGTLLPANYTFAASDLKIIKPDGTIANATNPPTATPNSPITNLFDFTFAQAEIATQVGPYTLILHNPATLTDFVWVETVDVDTRPAAFWQTLRAGNQPTGSFGETLDARISAIVAAHVAATSAPTKPYSVIKGDLEPDMEIDVIDLDGTPVNLSAATSITLRWTRPGQAATVVALTAIDLTTGEMKRVWSAGDTDLVGTHRGQIVVTWANAETTTYPRDGSQYQWAVYTRLA